MAANKDKLLESAQKNLKKKQVIKAIKDYAKVVEIDPGDVRSRQKLAELYVRINKNAEAYEQYEAIAKYFSSNGFYLKAIAIYKQMQRLDPSQVAIYHRLAELNEKQGLLGNAMAEYRTLVNYYERNGMLADTIKTLEKMRDLDSTNLNVRVKLAEVYAQNNREDDGLTEFEGVLATLTERKEFDKILKLYKMFLPIYPHHKKLQMGLALALYEKGDYDQGVTILNNQLKDTPENPDVLRLLGRGYAAQQNWERAELTYRTLLEMDPSDLDIREALIRCHFDKKSYNQALVELEEWKEAFFKLGRLEQLRGYYERLKEALPGDATVLRTLDSIYELTGEGDKLLDIITETRDEPEPAVNEETLSDSLLVSVDEDIEAPVLELDFDLAEDGEQAPLEEETSLELEPVEEGEELFELDISSETDQAVAGEELDFSLEMDEEQIPSGAPATEIRDIRADLEETEFYLQQGLYEEAERLCREILNYAPDSIACRQKLEEISALMQQSGAAEPFTGLDDLAAELQTNDFPELEELEETPTTSGSDKKKVFRTDVDEQIAADDLESHYNLGIAYREMGLFEDAISEFEKAAKDPSRYVDCQLLKALCYADRGDTSNAELMLKQALNFEHLGTVQRLNLGYELGLLYERSERFEEAFDSYQAVFTQDDSYRDVREKLAQLREKLGITDDDRLGGAEGKERISYL